MCLYINHELFSNFIIIYIMTEIINVQVNTLEMLQYQYLGRIEVRECVCEVKTMDAG